MRYKELPQSWDTPEKIDFRTMLPNVIYIMSTPSVEHAKGIKDELSKLVKAEAERRQNVNVQGGRHGANFHIGFIHHHYVPSAGRPKSFETTSLIQLRIGEHFDIPDEQAIDEMNVRRRLSYIRTRYNVLLERQKIDGHWRITRVEKLTTDPAATRITWRDRFDALEVGGYFEIDIKQAPYVRSLATRMKSELGKAFTVKASSSRKVAHVIRLP